MSSFFWLFIESIYFGILLGLFNSYLDDIDYDDINCINEIF